MNNLLDKISFLLLSVLVFLLPLFFLPVNINFIQFGTSIIFVYATILAFIAFAVLTIRNGQITLSSGDGLIKTILLLSVPLIYTISFFFNMPTNYAFFGYIFDVTTVGFIILAFMFMFLVSVIFNEKKRIFYGFVAVMVSSLVLAVLTILKFIFGGSFLGFGVFNNITQSVLGGFNNFGIFFAVSAVLSMISLEMINFSKVFKVLINICLVLSVIFLFAVDFSIIWYSVGLISLIFFLYSRFYRKDDFAYDVDFKKWKSYSLALFLVCVIFTFFKYPHDLFIKATDISFIEVRPSVSITYDMFISSMKNNMLLGSGPNTFLSQWIMNKPMDINNTVFWNTDFQYGFGLIPTYILTTGLLGLLSWILFFVAFLFLGAKSIFSKLDDRLSDYLNISSFFISLFLWIVALVYIPSLPIYILTLFMTGLFLAQNYIYKTEKTVFVFKDNPKVAFIVSLFITASVVFLLFISYRFYRNSMAVWNLQKTIKVLGSGKDFDKAEAYINKSIKYMPYDIYYRTKSDISNAKIESILSSTITKENVESARNTFISELQKSIESSLKAKERDPKNYLNYIYMGNSYALAVPKSYRIKGAYESSLSSYNQAMVLNPKNPAIPLLMARLEIDNENIKKAKEYINDAISKKNNYLDAYFLLSQIQISENNINEAIKSVETAVIIDPTNPALFFQLGLLYYNTKNYNNAVLALQKSIEITPEYANARYFLGLSLSRLGEYKLALAHFEELLKTNPDSKDLMDIINDLSVNKSPFEDTKIDTKSKKLPVKENN